MMRRYSRLSGLKEQKENTRKALFFTLLSVCLIILFFIYGIPTVARLASFVGGFSKTNKPIQIADTIPPVQPTFENLPVATNSANLVVNGRTESGATVTVNVNDNSNDIVADSNGQFTLSVSLNNGANTIWATAKDSSGNVSKPSNKISIAFSNKNPDLTISNPQDGATFNGASQKNLQIQGKTSPNVILTINDRLVDVASDGSFSFSTNLSDGDNVFTINATDQAGNITQKSLTVKFSS